MRRRRFGILPKTTEYVVTIMSFYKKTDGLPPATAPRQMFAGRDTALMSSANMTTRPSPVRVWGLPFAPLTFSQTLDAVDRLVAEGRPSYFITMNLHTAMLAWQDPKMWAAAEEAALVLADGMPLVWASRRGRRRLPERVAGSDLLPALCARAAVNGYRLFFLGGAPGVGEEAVRALRQRFPGLQVVGAEAPPFRPLSSEEEEALLGRIRAARPHLLFVAFGQPKGEVWLWEHYQQLGVPVCVQVGAALDFAAGRVPRAPGWLRRTGLEWAYRLWREPTRLAGRYAHNAAFLLRMLAAPRSVRHGGVASPASGHASGVRRPGTRTGDLKGRAPRAPNPRHAT
jgi:N-acetylglucosaminyldiphosphoundecaprenol N-acetyl-beta-D-mannosaminyltransferase